MSETVQPGRVRHERHGHVLKIVIDNPAKRNAFDPDMMLQLSQALTLLDDDAGLWAGVLCAAGDHFTAGLDMPKFFGPTAVPKPRPEGDVDPFGLGRKCRKPLVTAVSGITYTVGIEMMLAGDTVVAAEDSRFCQMEARRGSHCRQCAAGHPGDQGGRPQIHRGWRSRCHRCNSGDS